ncbi:hypothetical protein RI367_004058 [Sorochytrium milnesiophthora]
MSSAAAAAPSIRASQSALFARFAIALLLLLSVFPLNAIALPFPQSLTVASGMPAAPRPSPHARLSPSVNRRTKMDEAMRLEYLQATQVVFRRPAVVHSEL